MKKIVYFAILALIGLFAITCNKKDTTGPEIILHEPEPGQPFTAGDAHGVHIEFDLADESGLNQYKIDIHFGGGHTHSSPASARLLDESVEWSYQKTYDDAKNLKNHHVHVHSDSIPANASLGEYHLGILATDLEGNETTVYGTFEIVDYPVEDDED
jgi:hypothetical protein